MNLCVLDHCKCLSKNFQIKYTLLVGVHWFVVILTHTDIYILSVCIYCLYMCIYALYIQEYIHCSCFSFSDGKISNIYLEYLVYIKSNGRNMLIILKLFLFIWWRNLNCILHYNVFRSFQHLVEEHTIK